MISRYLLATLRRAFVILSLAGLPLVGAGVEPAAAQSIERDMYVSVLDEHEAPVAGLGPSDFIVREDGVAREVLRVRAATAPMQIAILIDNTQAAAAHILDVRRAVSEFIGAMGRNNEIALIMFGERPTITTDYTSDPVQLKKGVDRLFAMPGSGAYLLDAIVETSRGIRKREFTRPVIVVIGTDGVEFSNQHHDPVLQALRDSGAALHVEWLGQMAGDIQSDEIRYRNLVMDRGTRATGGRLETLLTSMALSDALKKLVAELTHQYLVTYARPPSLIPPERTEVSVKQRGLVARGTISKISKGS